MEMMGQMQTMIGAMKDAMDPPAPPQAPPPPPPMSPATRDVLAQPGAPPLEALMAQLVKQRNQRAG
jgi:hypothetical protein